VELWTALVPILLANVLNPVLLGALILTLGSSRPLLLSSSLLLGRKAKERYGEEEVHEFRPMGAFALCAIIDLAGLRCAASLSSRYSL
jgi:hypothetical protein